MKRTVILALAALLLLASLCGCSVEVAEEKSADIAVTEIAAEYGGGSSLYYYKAPNTTVTETVSSNRKLVKTVTMSVETESFDTMIADLDLRIAAFGGYAETVNITNYTAQTRTASYVIRIPADQVDAFTKQTGENCNVLSRAERQQDITMQYTDTQSEIDALKVEQERLLEILKTADDLKSILEIESRLTEIRSRLESVQSQLRVYDNQVAYATVNLTIDEVEVYTPTEVKTRSFGEKIKDGFLSSVRGVWSLLKGLAYFLIVALPYLIFGTIITATVLFVLHLVRRKRK